MQKLSTGDDSTLGSYLKLSRAFFGADSPATHFLEQKIAAAPKGDAEEVLADEGQMVYLLGRMHLDGQQSSAAGATPDGQDAEPASPVLADSEFKKTEPDAWL
jgi:hypothetical protein